MSDLEKAANHEVFRVERAGDLLIVTPQGDKLEFSNTLFTSEFERVKLLAARPEFRNVLVDLSNNAYFGSEMIGAIVNLRHLVAGSEKAVDHVGGSIQEGGVTALCGLSADMEAGLKIMHVDTIVLTFDSRAQAVRTLSHRTLTDRLRDSGIPWKPVLSFAAVCAVVAILVFSPLRHWLFRQTPAEQYQTITETYERWQSRREGALGSEDQIRVGRPFVETMNALRSDLSNYDKTTERVAVAEAAYRLLEWMGAPSNATSRKRFEIALMQARDIVSESSGQTLTYPESLDPPPKPSTESDPAAATSDSAGNDDPKDAEADQSESPVAEEATETPGAAGKASEVNRDDSAGNDAAPERGEASGRDASPTASEAN